MTVGRVGVRQESRAGHEAGESLSHQFDVSSADAEASRQVASGEGTIRPALLSRPYNRVTFEPGTRHPPRSL